MKSKVLQLFKETYKIDASFFSKAPGRLEILGNHTDYNEGFVLSTAVNCYTYIALRVVEGNICKVFSPQVEDKIRSFDLQVITDKATDKDWLNYIKGVVREFQKRSHNLPAFEAAIYSNVPLSAGMSSSASLEMALTSCFYKVLGLKSDIGEMARIGQGCENNYIGANTGLMDQFTSLSGQEGHFVLSEYRDLSIETVKVPENISLIVFNSGVKHDLSEEYNERREQCEKAVEILKSSNPEIEALRDVNPTQLQAAQEFLPVDTFKRALHVVGENHRVKESLERLSQNNIETFGKLLFESHESSMENFENSCDELDFLVKIAQDSELCYGARLSGGGFGGISIHLVKNESVEEYKKEVIDKFHGKFGCKPEVFICQSSNGATTEELI